MQLLGCRLETRDSSCLFFTTFFLFLLSFLLFSSCSRCSRRRWTIVVCCRTSVGISPSLFVVLDLRPAQRFVVRIEREKRREEDERREREEEKWMFGGFFSFRFAFDCSSASVLSASIRKMMDVNRGPKKRGWSGEENSLSLSFTHSRTYGGVGGRQLDRRVNAACLLCRCKFVIPPFPFL